MKAVALVEMDTAELWLLSRPVPAPRVLTANSHAQGFLQLEASGQSSRHMSHPNEVLKLHDQNITRDPLLFCHLAINRSREINCYSVTEACTSTDPAAVPRFGEVATEG